MSETSGWFCDVKKKNSCTKRVKAHWNEPLQSVSNSHPCSAFLLKDKLITLIIIFSNSLFFKFPQVGLVFFFSDLGFLLEIGWFGKKFQVGFCLFYEFVWWTFGYKVLIFFKHFVSVVPCWMLFAYIVIQLGFYIEKV